LFDIRIPYISLLPTKVIYQRKVVLSQQGNKLQMQQPRDNQEAEEDHKYWL